MTRHWQSNVTGVLATFRHAEPGASSWTEVQVVPLDAIVIERSELPEVKVNEAGLSANAGDTPTYVTPSCTAARARNYALGSLAIAEYLTAHPPVDEADLQLITDILSDLDVKDPKYIARQLLTAGIKPEVLP